jgi:hypothetical protein
MIEIDAVGCPISIEMARKIRWKMTKADIEPDVVRFCFEQKIQIENLAFEVQATYITKEMLDEAAVNKQYPHRFAGVPAGISADNPRDEIQFFLNGVMVARIKNLARLAI